MADDKNWIEIFEFLCEHLSSQDVFRKEDLESQTNWKGTTFPTHFSKRIKQFLIPAGSELFRVTEAFRPFAADWHKFQREVVTQVRRVFSDYTVLAHHAVLIFEFFMPLTNETHLRNTLDALFYRDTVLNRLRAVGVTELQERIPAESGENDDSYLDRVCEWISNKFVGYSISQVTGRFRAGDLSTIAQASHLQEKGRRYLVDETTAIVKFIFPCGDPTRKEPPLVNYDLVMEGAGDDDKIDDAIKKEADMVRWFFSILFVESIVQTVNGEDEIWMVESGLRNALHIWRAED